MYIKFEIDGEHSGITVLPTLRNKDKYLQKAGGLGEESLAKEWCPEIPLSTTTADSCSDYYFYSSHHNRNYYDHVLSLDYPRHRGKGFACSTFPFKGGLVQVPQMMKLNTEQLHAQGYNSEQDPHSSSSKATRAHCIQEPTYHFWKDRIVETGALELGKRALGWKGGRKPSEKGK